MVDGRIGRAERCAMGIVYFSGFERIIRCLFFGELSLILRSS
ncbi:hypothetical protein HMPREF9074_08146 [Capnocytophaga sp. oral taxon 329 str. F0087]|nr:hypothetical protein HMPREF9074_08146 [Capnocytophaga sp. oral taxon 329 str. F0087]